MHDVPYVGHYNYQNTVEAVMKDYYWPWMKNKIVDYIARCLECQKVKFEHRHSASLLQPLHISEWKWDVLIMDFITKLPKTKSQHDAIMVVVDKLTKATQFTPVKTTHKATEIVYIYMKEVARLHDIPKEFVSDRDSKFTGHFWKGLSKGFGTEFNMITSHQPPTDGQEKRVNQVI